MVLWIYGVVKLGSCLEAGHSMTKRAEWLPGWIDD